MKKSVSIFFMALYLLAGTQITELIKMPVLAGHYMEHREDGNLSLYEFLRIHYSNSEDHHASHDSDSKFPFKTYQCSCSFAVLPAPAFHEVQKEARANYPDAKSDNFNYSFFYSSIFHSLVWQPPRQC